LALAVFVIASACTPGKDSEDAHTGCSDTVDQAWRAIEVADQVALLDTALLTCRSYSTLVNELKRHPGIVGYSVETFVQLRCERIDDEAVKTGPACSTVITPTTAPPTTIVDLVFVGDTLDGRRIEIRPDALTEFVGDVPAIVQQTVDIAIESGCEGVIAQRDLWASKIFDPTIGDRASVYAQHAQNVADYIKCESTPLDVAALTPPEG
jgi:hypothetical protein